MKKKTIVIFILWALLLVGMRWETLAAPRLNAEITKNNILSLLDDYDADSAYILRTTSTYGSDHIMNWWMTAKSIIDSIDTGVHEEYHEYSFLKAPWGSEDIYIGRKKSIRVPFTPVFPSKQMAPSIPSDLRAMRWSTYIGNPMPNLISNEDGVYGLLNEFTAYYWGMHAQLSLYDYYRTAKASAEQWKDFVNFCANDRLAYVEFKYYILQYLVYAKQHDPEVYRGIIHNTKFVEAYQKIERKFAVQIRQFEKRLKDIEKLLEAEGYRVEVGEYFYIYEGLNGHGVGIFQNMYQKLTAELQKAKYRNILDGGTAAAPGKASVSSLKSSGTGIKIVWNSVQGANGYYIYRKAADENAYTKVKTVSSLSWTDSAVQSGKQYSYKVAAYAKADSGNIVKGADSDVRTYVWLKSPQLQSTANTAAGQMTVKWKKDTSATGYQVSWSASRRFSPAQTVAVKASASEKTIRSLTKQKTYYVRVRSCLKKSGKTYYSPWSNVRSVKISR